jgi:hypothetical protein
LLDKSGEHKIEAYLYNDTDGSIIFSDRDYFWVNED